MLRSQGLVPVQHQGWTWSHEHAQEHPRVQRPTVYCCPWAAPHNPTKLIRRMQFQHNWLCVRLYRHTNVFPYLGGWLVKADRAGRRLISPAQDRRVPAAARTHNMQQCHRLAQQSSTLTTRQPRVSEQNQLWWCGGVKRR